MSTFPNKLALALLAGAMSLPLATLGHAATAPDAADAKMTTDATMKPDGMQAKVEQRIADMHATLRITTAQDGEFNKFAQVMLDNAQAMDALLRKNAATRDTEGANAVLHDYAQVAEQHAKNVDSLATAFDSLYGTLTPQQKQQADQMFRDTGKDQKHAG